MGQGNGRRARAAVARHLHGREHRSPFQGAGGEGAARAAGAAETRGGEEGKFDVQQSYEDASVLLGPTKDRNRKGLV